MHIHLRERYVETFLRKGFVHLLIHAEKHSPIIICLGPSSHSDVDGTVVELANLNERLGVCQDERVVFAEAKQHRFGLSRWGTSSLRRGWRVR